VGGLGLLCLLCFSPIVLAVMTEAGDRGAVVARDPLGAVERAMGASWVVTVVALGWWAVRAVFGQLIDRHTRQLLMSTAYGVGRRRVTLLIALVGRIRSMRLLGVR
jgi:MFS family permease